MKLKEFSDGIKIRLFDMFFTVLISAVLIIVKPLYLVSNFGAELASVLLIASIIIGIMIGFYGGYLSDVIGRKKMMIRGQVLLLTALILLVVSNSPWLFSPWLTYLGFVLITISGALYSPASEAMLIDLSTDEDRKYMYTYMSVINNISFGIGALLAGFLFENHFFQLSVVMTIASVCTLLILIFLIKETYKGKGMTAINTPREKLKDMATGYKKVLQNKMFLLYFVGSIVIVAFESQIFNHIGVRLVEVIKNLTLFNWTIDGAKFISILSIENVLVIILCGGFVAYLMKKFKERQLMSVGIAMATIGYIVLATSDVALALMIAILVSTFGELLYIPIKQSYLGHIAEKDSRSSYIAINSLSFNIGMMFSSFLILVGSYLDSYMFILYLVMGVVMLVISLKLNSGLNRKDK